MKVNEPDSLVCWFERTMVRVSPLATADSVEFGTSQPTVNAAATASCATAPPRLAHLLRLKPANNPSFPNTSRPAAKPADWAQRCHHLTLLPASAADPPRPPERLSLALPVRIVTRASQLRQKAIYFAYSPISRSFQS